MARKIVNGVFFQIVWTACVWGGGSGRWWLGPLLVTVFALWQIPRSLRPRGELWLVLSAIAIGIVVDSAFMRAGLLSYPAPGPWQGLAPIWILALWAGFALTLNHSLAWIKGRPVVAALLGGIAGPFSYWVGSSAWKAVDFVAPTPVVLAVLGISWGLVTPGLVALAARFQRLDLVPTGEIALPHRMAPVRVEAVSECTAQSTQAKAR
jgi:hypothetical protein